jgi:hypothetical protein
LRFLCHLQFPSITQGRLAAVEAAAAVVKAGTTKEKLATHGMVAAVAVVVEVVMLLTHLGVAVVSLERPMEAPQVALEQLVVRAVVVLAVRELVALVDQAAAGGLRVALVVQGFQAALLA